MASNLQGWLIVRRSDGVVLAHKTGGKPTDANAALTATEGPWFLLSPTDANAAAALVGQAEREGRTLTLSGFSVATSAIDWEETVYSTKPDGEITRRTLQKIAQAFDALTGGTLALGADSRFYVSVVPDKTEALANGVDGIVLTISALNGSDAVRTGFNQTVKAQIAGKWFKLTFVAGVVTKTVKSLSSGTVSIRSTKQYRLKDPVDLEFVD